MSLIQEGSEENLDIYYHLEIIDYDLYRLGIIRSMLLLLLALIYRIYGYTTKQNFRLYR